MKHDSLPYALNQDNVLVYVDDVPKGKPCNCICPYCKSPLVAKNAGKIKEHHFAHISKETCIHAFQSMLHILAKDIFLETKNFTAYKFRNGKWESRKYKVSNAYLETKFKDIIPDIILDCDGIFYLVEIYVSHKLDDIKKQKIIEELKFYSTIEFDLSKIDRNITKDKLKSILFNSRNPPISWVFDADVKRFYNKYIFLKENGIEQEINSVGKVMNCPFTQFRNRRTGQTEQCKIKKKFCENCTFFSGIGLENGTEKRFCGGNIEDKQSVDLRVFNGIQRVLTDSEYNEWCENFSKQLKNEVNGIITSYRPSYMKK